MPELPEVESVKRMLSPKVIGKKITGVEVFDGEIVRVGDLSSIIGCKIVSIDRFGKYLRFQTDSLFILFVHFGMSGIFAWNGSADQKLNHIRATIGFEDDKLIYDDVRKLKGLYVYDDDTLPWKKLGIDALDKEFTPSTLSELIKHRKRAIKLVLLDQAVVAGIGNIYASEILFASHINPFREARSLDDKEIQRLHSATISVLKAAIDANGTTLKDYKLSDGKDGNFQNFLKVYGKKDGECPSCKSPIIKIKQAQRSTYYCSNSSCQR